MKHYLFNKKDFKMIESLENLSKDKLLEICVLNYISLSFNDTDNKTLWQEWIDKESIISALMADFDLPTLERALQDINKENKNAGTKNS